MVFLFLCGFSFAAKGQALVINYSTPTGGPITVPILSGNFVMMMMVDLSMSSVSLETVKTGLNDMGNTLGVSISMMHEGVFSAMHRI